MGELSTGRQDGGEGGGGREEGGGEDGGRLHLRAGGPRNPGTRGGLAKDGVDCPGAGLAGDDGLHHLGAPLPAGELAVLILISPFPVNPTLHTAFIALF